MTLFCVGSFWRRRIFLKCSENLFIYKNDQHDAKKSQQAEIKWLIYPTKISQYFKCHYWSPLVFLPCQHVPLLVTARLLEIEAVAGTFQLLLSQVAWQCEKWQQITHMLFWAPKENPFSFWFKSLQEGFFSIMYGAAQKWSTWVSQQHHSNSCFMIERLRQLWLPV